ncbi:lipid binding protein [Basidiobolus meristosporus CBS 931.73]|uniref:Sorting nexin-4 n=1 Tax=Basidiobolus meristosporus CBS 931.73 TaxID=1314790 RepID=A0A1Y1ZB74_9FUNG|nr:lipid binding protein [Basidiobolus meristosporus CBS 931.73]|eukprot:ORY07227.1 lipid binding protein [Basidiobolus meristosporus CBS 931.73]
MKVSIVDPQKEYEGTTAQHISYLVTTETELSTFPKPNIQVRRRFQEFVWLYNTLVYEYPACIIPPLPEKHRMEYLKGDRFGQEFVEKRKDSLERFLQRIARHPTLQKSECLRIFLTSDKFFEYQMLQSNDSAARAKGEGVFENIGDAIINAFTKVQKPDDRFSEIKETIDKFEENLHTIEKLYQKIIKKQNELELEYAELGTEVKGLSELETRIADPLTKFGDAINKHTSATKHMINQEEGVFLSQIHEYISYCASIKGVMKLREQKQVDFEELTAFLNQQKNEREKLINHEKSTGLSSFIKGKYDEIKGVDQEKARQNKLEKVEAKVKELEDAVNSSNDVSVKFSEEVLKEFEIFQTSKTVDLKTSFNNYCHSQVEYYKTGISIWEEIIPILEGIHPQ